jgi:hypothetical protein
MQRIVAYGVLVNAKNCDIWSASKCKKIINEHESHVIPT